MSDIFNTEEQDISQEIINYGLSKAADSMAFFTKEKVFVKSIDLQVKTVDSIRNLSQKYGDEEVYVLITELKGELEGVCYLVLSEKEVGEILKTSLPASILNDLSKLEEMSEAILLEMDNIVVAAVVTQFSNLFNYKIYGGVPTLSKIKPDGLAGLVETASKTAKSALYFNSEFLTTEMQINPEFICLLNDKYIDGVKLIAQNQDLFLKMRSTICY